jgi:hypothetical protein
VAGVIGYPAKKRQPALIAPSAQAVSPFMKNSPTSGPTLGMALFPLNFLFLKRCHHNGKIRADEFAQTAVNTVVTASGINRMIPFTIELCRFLQYLSGAKLDAKLTSFALILQDFNLAVTGLYLVLI